MKSLILLLLMAGCAQLAVHEANNNPPPQVVPVAATDVGTPSSSVIVPGRPACLNIRDGEWRVEFNGREIVVGATSPLKNLVLDQGRSVRCTRLEIINGARNGSALIEFTRAPLGTSVSIRERVLGVASIRSRTWLVEPITLERQIYSDGKVETREKLRADWLLDSSGRPLLTLTDPSTHKVRSFSP